MTNNDPERPLRLARWALGVLLALLFVLWPCVVPPVQPAAGGQSSAPLPVLIVTPAGASPTVYVFATATPTAQAADRLPTLAGTRTPTMTFTPMPSATPTVTPARSPVMRG